MYSEARLSDRVRAQLGIPGSGNVSASGPTDTALGTATPTTGTFTEVQGGGEIGTTADA